MAAMGSGSEIIESTFFCFQKNQKTATFSPCERCIVTHRSHMPTLAAQTFNFAAFKQLILKHFMTSIKALN
jgi:hypothetical protein